MEVGMVSRVGVVSDDFRKQVLGYGLTTAQILYRMPDHPSLLQTYVWQNYDLFPNFPALKDFLSFWEEKLEGPLFAVTVAHSKLIKPAELPDPPRENISRPRIARRIARPRRGGCRPQSRARGRNNASPSVTIATRISKPMACALTRTIAISALRRPATAWRRRM